MNATKGGALMPQFPRILDTVQVAMKAANTRHMVLSNNITNVNVPGYKGFEVVFEDELKRALEPAPAQQTMLEGLTSDQRHIPIPQSSVSPPVTSVEPRIIQTGDQMRQDGNNVDIEDQMAKLAANQLWYQALVRSMSDELSRLRLAITEGRR
jgi:flagellar basal-body rod protein FlgB